jgi:glyoxylase I family protein
MIHGVHHIALNTGNFDRMVGFYRDVLGFAPDSRDHAWYDSPETDRATGLNGSAARHIWLRAGNCYIEIFEYTAPQPPGNAPLRPFDRGYTHIALDVTDIESEFDRLVAAGTRFEHERPVDFGAIQAIYGRDPDGNIIELQQMAADHACALGRLR